MRIIASSALIELRSTVITSRLATTASLILAGCVLQAKRLLREQRCWRCIVRIGSGLEKPRRSRRKRWKGSESARFVLVLVLVVVLPPSPSLRRGKLSSNSGEQSDGVLE